MSQSTTATMQFGLATTRPTLARWWADVAAASTMAARRMFDSPTAGPVPPSTYHSYLEHACMAREMDRL